ncbi:uncharacterized protein LOC122503162 [Leptopilina heterotoma]|uniref:uncharacterized protein LOC122503162 n=1 Tax=Leptopilina heterotoma TaxID=63436 RepID=UPI001CAA22AA|nr:uncharacterized protein LOC122503162 [Leptopilina heterotoma]
MPWVCVKYTRQCSTHCIKRAYVIPSSYLEVKKDHYNSKKEYKVRCVKDEKKWCYAIIGRIDPGSDLKAKNRLMNKRISFPPVSDVKKYNSDNSSSEEEIDTDDVSIQ